MLQKMPETNRTAATLIDRFLSFFSLDFGGPAAVVVFHDAGQFHLHPGAFDVAGIIVSKSR